MDARIGKQSTNGWHSALPQTDSEERLRWYTEQERERHAWAVAFWEGMLIGAIIAMAVMVYLAMALDF